MDKLFTNEINSNGLQWIRRFRIEEYADTIHKLGFIKIHKKHRYDSKHKLYDS